MSITISFTAPTEEDISLINLYGSTASTGTFDFVYSSGITTSSTYVIYEAGSSSNWYKISFEDTYGNESPLSAAIYGGGTNWDDYLIPIIRTKIDDWGDTYTYSDDDLKKRLITSGLILYQMAYAACPFSIEYSFSISNEQDVDNWDIVPDPIYEDKDNNFVNLLILKTLSDITSSSFFSNSLNAIKIKDGDTSVDTSASLGGYKDMLNSRYGYAEAFEFAWREYLRTNGSSQAICHFGRNSDDWITY